MKAIGCNAGNERAGKQTTRFRSGLGAGVVLSLTPLMGAGPVNAGKASAKLERLDAGPCADFVGAWGDGY